MLIAPSQAVPLPILPTGTSGGETTARTEAAPARLPAAVAGSTETPSAAATDSVTLSSPAQSRAPAMPPPTYAEVWKNGFKVAEIDSHGGVSSFAGPIALPAGGALGGPWLAAIRAAQVAQSVGGEIRINGMTLDAGTLRTRVQLETTYRR